MSDNESDEDLKRAIALSLQDSNPASRSSGRQDVIDLISDEEEDNDLDAPLFVPQAKPRKKTPPKQAPEPSKKTPVKAAKSLVVDLSKDRNSPRTQHTPKRSSPAKPEKPPVINLLGDDVPDDPRPEPEPAPAAVTLPMSGLLGLNRKQMEEQRLARRNAMNTPDAVPPNLTPATKKRRAESPLLREPDTRNFKARTPIPVISLAKQPSIFPKSSSAPRNSGGTPSAKSAIQYPNGVVKKTWAFGYPREGDDIKIEEVLQKDDLELAVLSSWQIDTEWIETKLLPKTHVVWVLQAKTEAERQNWRDRAPNHYRFCFPKMVGFINTMHSKLQLLSHGSYLRIAIPTANLMPYDWGESGVMENVCFLIDLPRLPNGQIAELETPFAIELSYYCKALGLDQKIVDSLKKFDFSRTERLAFVHTIGGAHDTAWQRTGFPGLGLAVRKLGSATDEALEIDFLAASIGSLNTEFITAMYLACQGDKGLTEYGWRTGNASRGKVKGQDKGPAETKRKPSDDLMSRCRVYFPTDETVVKSNKGRDSGGTISMQQNYWNSGHFPKSLMRDCISKRSGMLMHCKMIFIRGPKIALAYVGSANLSESAWGKLVKDKTTKQPKLNCRNWECGVLLLASNSALPMKSPDHRARKGVQDTLDMDVFDGVVPVPMVVPGEAYGTRMPWFFAK